MQISGPSTSQMSLSGTNSSTLARYRPAILALTAVAAGCSIYYIHNIIWSSSGSSSSSLRRRNAIHRSNTRRRNDEIGVTLDDLQDTANGQDAAGEAQIVDVPEIAANDSESEHSWREAGEDEKKEGQSLLNLLYHIAEDQARRDGYVHRQVTCNGCSTIPIRGIRYRCANCVDYDLCEQCEALQVHQKTHVFYKVRIPAPFPFLGNPRQPQPVWYPGKPNGLQQRMPRELTIRLCKESGFEDAEVSALWDQFKCLAGTEWPEDPNRLYTAIDRRTFDRCFLPSTSLRPPPPNLIYDLMFAFYDIDGDGLIGFEEFVLGLASLRNKNQDDKLRRVFRGYDLDRDGYVNRKDFLRIFRAYYALVKELSRDYVAGMEEDILESGARDVVASSQPLSSAFSGTISTGEPSRTGHGKIEDENGDLIVVDGQGISRESGREEGDFHEVVGDTGEAAVFHNIRPTQRDYFASMLVPDGQFMDSDFDASRNRTDLDETFFGDTLDMIRRQVREEVDTHSNIENGNNEEEGGNDDQASGFGEQANDLQEEQQNGDGWPPAQIEVQDVENALGNYVAILDVKNKEDRERVLRAASKRIHSNEMKKRQSVRQKAIHERWLRRQFYIDEENGALPPPGFEDLPEDSTSAEPPSVQTVSNSTTKSRQEPSRRSRSSSKVRFEDDLIGEEHETRSSTSVSSRSIPLGERWGGYDMPEAEKDVGREVLYQVTQEGLNEMLNPIFKQREDLAVEILRKASERQQAREHLDFVEFASKPMHKLIETQIAKYLRNWRIEGHWPELISTSTETECIPPIVSELRKMTFQEINPRTPEYHIYMQLRKMVGLPVPPVEIIPLHQTLKSQSVSEPLNSNPVGLSQSNTCVGESGTESSVTSASNSAVLDETSSPLASTTTTSLSQPTSHSPVAMKASTETIEAAEIEYPAAAIELHSAVAAFNEADPAIEEVILQKPLDQLLQESGYSITTIDATSQQMSNSSTPGPASPTSHPDPMLPQNRPNRPNHPPSSSQSTRDSMPMPANIHPAPNSLPQGSPLSNSHPNPPRPHSPEPNLSTPVSRLAALLDLPSRLPKEQEPNQNAAQNDGCAAKINQARLKYLAMLDYIEQVDERRGGPGRLDFEEFKEIMKSERGKSLGFVGNWVEMASL